MQLRTDPSVLLPPLSRSAGQRASTNQSDKPTKNQLLGKVVLERIPEEPHDSWHEVKHPLLSERLTVVAAGPTLTLIVGSMVVSDGKPESEKKEVPRLTYRMAFSISTFYLFAVLSGIGTTLPASSYHDPAFSPWLGKVIPSKDTFLGAHLSSCDPIPELHSAHCTPERQRRGFSVFSPGRNRSRSHTCE